MLRRPFCGMAACFLLGILVAAYGSPKLLTGMVVGTSVMMGLFLFLMETLRKRKGRLQACQKNRMSGEGIRQGAIVLRVVLCILMLALGGTRYHGEEIQRAEYLPYLKDGMQLSVQGRLAAKQVKKNQYIYELSACVLRSYQNEHRSMEAVSCNPILVYSESDMYSIGEILVLDGTVKLWESAANEGNFDAEKYYQARKMDFTMTDVEIRGVYGKENFIAEWLWELRLRLKKVYQSIMSSKTCGVMTTMALGDKELLEAEVRQLYQVGGLSHILAISGLHISVVGMTLYGVLRKGGLGFGVAGGFACILLLAYGWMVGMGTSVRRALFMFALQLLAAAIGRSYDTLNSLGVAAVVLLWSNPYILWDAGFQFSFVAIIGVAYVGRSADFSQYRFGKMLDKLYVSAAILLTTLPFVAWYYYEIPLYALVMNLLILPMLGFVLGAGLIGGLLGLLSAVVAEVVLFPCEKLLELQLWLCELCKRLPGAVWITGRPHVGQVALYYVILLTFTFLAYRKKVIPGKQEETAERRISLPKMLKGMAGMLLLVVIICAPIGRKAELNILDVGQGDGSFLRTAQGYTIFVDGGSSDVSKVGTYRMLPFLKYKGARKIDCWVVSHTDEDHISGLLELLEQGYEIKRLVFSAGIVRDEAFGKLTGLAERKGTEIVYLNAGDTIYLGDATLTAVYPAVDAASDLDGAWKKRAEDKNASSLVVWYEENGFSGIFTGDIGMEQEREIVAGLDRRVDFYKAAHHGSKYSNSEALLGVLKPTIATVSCGKTNRYGHPAKEALERMEKCGAKIFYTMESGQITIGWDEDGVWVKEYRQ